MDTSQAYAINGVDVSLSVEAVNCLLTSGLLTQCNIMFDSNSDRSLNSSVVRGSEEIPAVNEGNQAISNDDITEFDAETPNYVAADES